MSDVFRKRTLLTLIRAGFSSDGELREAVENGAELTHIRHLGVKGAAWIRHRLGKGLPVFPEMGEIPSGWSVIAEKCERFHWDTCG